MKSAQAFLIIASIFFAQPVQAIPKPLFYKDRETFLVVDDKSKTPVFRVLNNTVAKRNMALTLNSILKLSNSEIQVTPYVDIRLEKIILKPLKNNSDKISITLQVSDKEYEIEPELKRSELLAGKKITVKIPPKVDQAAIYILTTKSEFTLTYKPTEDMLLIDNLLVDIKIENRITPNEDSVEQIKFKGKGLRQ
ncbi:MAG: hypothetical protein SGI74_04350 [Oligoflexia bacterium]|nr:hypothetical protein [Oligoflexia bacterium]